MTCTKYVSATTISDEIIIKNDCLSLGWKKIK